MFKCPQCEKFITRLTINPIEAAVLFGTVFNAVVYSCPYCGAAIPAQIDPVAIKTDIIDGLMERLRK